MRVTNTRIPLTILSVAASCGLVLAIHTGQARSGAAPTVSRKAPEGSSSSQWHWQNPLPQGNTLRGASFVDANTGTVVGDYGTIVRTTNGGNSWTVQASGTTQDLWAVSFTDANNGTACGRSRHHPWDHRWRYSLGPANKRHNCSASWSLVRQRCS